ncbi:MAG TPA: hypothetical protein P5571_05665 [Candidatus Krumholzibacteria bacterium]|nr:hypothetical protein [Candidatus Krumholzibacteria bacterium]HRX50826.1 hypothetical protein [Candidatus Krumholzibacteria bacterium]
MNKNYLCPHCRAVLNPNVKVVLVAERNDRRALLLLNARPGDYGFIADPSFPLDEGEPALFRCPVCGADLTSPSSSEFAELIQVEDGGHEARVEFSRVYGRHATFIVDGREVTAFGEDADDYDDLNFFGH